MQQAMKQSCSVNYPAMPRAVVHIRLSQQLKEALLLASASGLRATLRFDSGSQPNVPPPPPYASLSLSLPDGITHPCILNNLTSSERAGMQTSAVCRRTTAHMSLPAGHLRWRSHIRIHGARGEQLRPRQASHRTVSGRGSHGDRPHHTAPLRQGSPHPQRLSAKCKRPYQQHPSPDSLLDRLTAREHPK